MTSPDVTGADSDTFDRSCAHWSEAGREEMDSFYVLAVEDYRQLALSFDWVHWLKDREQRAGGRPVRLLDVACGSGKFPSALVRHAGLQQEDLALVQYDLLDPTAFSLRETRRVLQPPFQAGEDYLCRLQDLDTGESLYDIVWATHALYALPQDELDIGLTRFMGALSESGSGFIAHACQDSHYLQFYNIYLDTLKNGTGTPYLSAESIVEGLAQLGVQCNTRDIDYTCRVPLDAAADVEGYLQRCLFDDSLSLEAMLAEPAMAQYLEQCRDAEGWCFRQRVKTIFFSA